MAQATGPSVRPDRSKVQPVGLHEQTGELMICFLQQGRSRAAGPTKPKLLDSVQIKGGEHKGSHAARLGAAPGPSVSSRTPHLPEPPDILEGLEGALEAEAEPGEEGLHSPRTFPFCGERSGMPAQRPRSEKTG